MNIEIRITYQFNYVLSVYVRMMFNTSFLFNV